MHAAVVTIQAPAKLNLSLAVLERRADGFHEIESLMAAVDLADTLSLTTGGSPGIRLAVQFAGPLATPRGRPLARDVPADTTNLVVRAVAALASEAGMEPALDIELVKRIPSGAGLGGGSSDAAAGLAAAAELWKLDWPRARLAEIGGRIGSDVPWFFAGGAAVAAGRGERILPVESLMPLFAVIACPPEGLSTAAVYQACTPSWARASEAAALAAALAAGDFHTALPLLSNDLEPPARRLSPEVDRLLADLARAGGLCPRLTGSGSACFTLCRTQAEARGIAARLAALEDDGRPRWPLVEVVRVGGQRPPPPGCAA
jgi:4-diphosphocytidyl-2-C-methyl-D-erythritol kinase